MFFAPKDMKFGDFDIIEIEGMLNCIFIQRKKSESHLPIGNSYGLATTDDGFNWQYQGTVMKTQPGWQSGSLWAMNLIKEDPYQMFYTAVSDKEKDPHPSQQVGFATSIDLVNWKVNKEPIITNKQTNDKYYLLDKPKFCWRDPDIHKVNNTYYCLLAAKDSSKEFDRSGCVALLKSDNKVEWENLPPLFSPNKYWEVETPHLYKLNNKWLLLFGEYTNGMSMRFAIADEFQGDYVEPEHNIFTPSYCYAGRIVKFDDKLLFYHWIRDRVVGKKETYLAPPKVVEFVDNNLFLKKHPKYDQKPTISKTFDSEFKITIDSDNPDHQRTIIFKNNKNFEIKDTTKNRTNDSRTIPIKLNEMKVDIYQHDQFIEIYINNYFIHSFIVNELKEIIKMRKSVPPRLERWGMTGHFS